MNDPTGENILKKTFEYLEEVLEEQNHQNKTGTGEMLSEKENSSNENKNKASETARGHCCSA